MKLELEIHEGEIRAEELVDYAYYLLFNEDLWATLKTRVQSQRLNIKLTSEGPQVVITDGQLAGYPPSDYTHWAIAPHWMKVLGKVRDW